MPNPLESPRPRMMTWPLALAFAASCGFSTSFYLMLSVVPLYAASYGARAGQGRGSPPALMLSTVAAELLTPSSCPASVTGRRSPRASCCSGLRRLFSVSLRPWPGFSPFACRGASAWGSSSSSPAPRVAELVPPGRRGEGLGAFGFGVVAASTGYPAAFALAALLVLAATAPARRASMIRRKR